MKETVTEIDTLGDTMVCRGARKVQLLKGASLSYPYPYPKDSTTSAVMSDHMTTMGNAIGSIVSENLNNYPNQSGEALLLTSFWRSDDRSSELIWRGDDRSSELVLAFR